MLLIIVKAAQAIWRISQSGSVYFASALRAVPLGDDSLIDSPGGRRQEKMLRNIVGEMAVAASISEPDIYVLLNEDKINAMAVGLHKDDLAVILTRGALRFLDRQEMSALLAHEFSHVVNNDTRHYTLMAGYLKGLYYFQNAGFELIFQHPAAVFPGLLIMFVGVAATVCGKILQAAFSRARERLADASAVRYTRDPSALARVLMKIGGQDLPPSRFARKLSELNHFFLAQPKKPETPSSWKALLSSHPPLAGRIWALVPNWDGWYWDFAKKPSDYFLDQDPSA
ncbi:MAG: M48 family metalloprotease [Deltaproteobacteria bacterium]|nr:M48 family metalloprotease [Deltaproteobacteria bacterium]